MRDLQVDMCMWHEEVPSVQLGALYGRNAYLERSQDTLILAAKHVPGVDTALRPTRQKCLRSRCLSQVCIPGIVMPSVTYELYCSRQFQEPQGKSDCASVQASCGVERLTVWFRTRVEVKVVGWVGWVVCCLGVLPG